jgi:hypothetical protein
MSDQAIPHAVVLAARKLGCQAAELLAWKVHSQPNQVVVVGPTGQKFTFSDRELSAVSDQQEAKEKVKAAAPAARDPVTKARRPAKK